MLSFFDYDELLRPSFVLFLMKDIYCQVARPPQSTMQPLADYLHGQRLHSWECGLTTDHNGKASVSPSHGS